MAVLSRKSRPQPSYPRNTQNTRKEIRFGVFRVFRGQKIFPFDMPVHIDAPVAGAQIDPADFRIRGWLWLEADHGDIAAVEAYDHGTLLGELAAAEFHERPDVNAKYGLPAGTRTGFEFPSHHPTAAKGTPFDLHLRVRLRDGSRTGALFTRSLAAPPLERHPFQMLRDRVPV